MNLPIRASLDEILSHLPLTGPHVRSDLPGKVLFWGEGVEEISSYVAGWMAGQGINVIVLDGANRFNPYMVSSLAKKVSIPPEKLLKQIRIARAFTCYQMAALMKEKLASLLREEETISPFKKPWVILLGPIATFLDEDVPEREAQCLFERSLRKLEGMSGRGIPFLIFQPSVPSHSKRASLMRSLLQFSDLVWKMNLDDGEPKMVLQKRPTGDKGIIPFITS